MTARLITVAPVADQRILAGRAATLEVFFTDQNGEPTEADGTVQVTITRANGAAIATDAATVADTETVGRYTYELAAGDNDLLDLLTAAWTDDSSTHETLVDVAGGVYFTIDEARIKDDSLTVEAYPLDVMLAARREVEIEFERICGAAFVPRYHRVHVDSLGSSSLRLPFPFVTRVREVSTGLVDFTDEECAAIATSINGDITVPSGAFPWFQQGIVGYEHGLTRTPYDIKTASIVRLRERLNDEGSAWPARATSVTEGGVTMQLGRADEYSTGNPDIDAVLKSHDYKRPTAQ